MSEIRAGGVSRHERIHVEQVLGRAPEHLLRPELDRRAADMLVGVADDDTTRTGPVGLANDGARGGRVLDLAEDDDLLAGLDVCPDADDELGVAPEALVVLGSGCG